ncbi:hypothetical protein [Enterococcus sp. BWR-S5]|uniref:hypothetical protein n=1 Tax=Enterococcus sp. BWR-S5 TaxID=2787714 RepID=UPI0019244573|nr:hypothetical protein [Enterococcus sp. BWR-S5]MBL1224818.1 hypothetical protein [Enterococcus sp. BWR-S5]
MSLETKEKVMENTLRKFTSLEYGGKQLIAGFILAKLGDSDEDEKERLEIIKEATSKKSA